MMSTLHQAGGQILQFTKGAPDEVLQRCAWMELEGRRVELTEARRQEILAANQGHGRPGAAGAVRCLPDLGQRSGGYFSRQPGAGAHLPGSWPV